MLHLLWIVPLVLLFAYVSSPRFRGDIAATRVRRILGSGLEKNRYSVLNDLVIPSGGGTAQIDHVVVSRFGIFVIKSQYVRGWVTGEEFQDRWKQKHWGRVTRIDNPLHQNALQVDALKNLLGLSSRAFVPVVVMVGHKGFTKAMPYRLLAPEKLLAYMRKTAQPVLEGDQADQVLQQIEAARVPPRAWVTLSKRHLLQIILAVLLLGGLFLTFRDELAGLKISLEEKQARKNSPEVFHPDGTRKSEAERWEDSLMCAYSPETGRCACYEPEGSKVDLGPEKCRSLAERGSVLKQ
jgi:hypothetical protein